jgi:hypothetical protein
MKDKYCSHFVLSLYLEWVKSNRNLLCAMLNLFTVEWVRSSV